jgi:outer membrane protein OmpA-like peptidoglycan-associated protein
MRRQEFVCLSDENRVELWYTGVDMRSIAIACLSLLPTLGFAQSPVEINTEFFKPATGNGFFGIQGSQILRNLVFKGDALFNFADSSLVAFDANGNVLLVPVERQLVLDVGLALGLFNFVELGVSFPLALNQAGDALEQIGGVGAIQGAAPGDLRFVAKAKLVGSPQQERGFFLAFNPELTVPTGSGGEFFGAASLAAKLALNAEWKAKRFNVGATVGPRFQEQVALDQVVSGNDLTFGLGTQLRVIPKLALLAEIEGARSLEVDGANPLEARVGAKLQLSKGLFIPIGAGFGLTQEVGAPNFRLFAGISYAPQEQLKDTDQDGLTNDEDDCPKEAEDKDNFKDDDGCPELDNDKDSIADAQDACPTESGPKDTQGCPDADGDGVANASDACPKTAGPKDAQGCPDSDQDGLADNKDSCPDASEDRDNFKDEDGCPELDNDEDKIVDKEDICPDEPENYNKIKDDDGCPDFDESGPKEPVPVTATASNAEVVYYSTGKVTISKDNKEKLDGILVALTADPSKKVRIDGYADDVGPARGNLELSQERAREIYRYLVKRGISKARITYKGYGEGELSDTKNLKESRAKNRRVEIYVE